MEDRIRLQTKERGERERQSMRMEKNSREPEKQPDSRIQTVRLTENEQIQKKVARQ